jgi:tetratricopeptide (TPR) repeat protein
MKASRAVTVVASVLLVGTLAASVFLQRKLEEARPEATLEEVLYVPSPKVLKRLSLGYDGLMADIYWTRAVQYFGGRHSQGSTRYELLAPLLEITTTLDPHLIVAYEFGANFLTEKPPNGAGEPRRAVDLMEFGIRNNPDEWRLYYNLAFIYYIDLKDYKSAAEWFERGSKVPNAHPWMKLWAANAAQKGGSIRMARSLWIATYQSTPDKMIRANAKAHLRALQVDEEVLALQAMVAEYQKRTGHLPGSFSDLIEAHMLGGVPADPLGHAYKLMPDGRIEVSVPDDLPFINEGTPPGYVAPMPKFLPSDEGP